MLRDCPAADSRVPQVVCVQSSPKVGPRGCRGAETMKSCFPKNATPYGPQRFHFVLPALTLRS